MPFYCPLAQIFPLYTLPYLHRLMSKASAYPRQPLNPEYRTYPHPQLYTSRNTHLACTSARSNLLQLASQVIYRGLFHLDEKTSHHLLQLSRLLFRVEIVEIIRYIHSISQREVFHDRCPGRSRTGRAGASSWHAASLLRKEACYDLDRHFVWPVYPASPLDSHRSASGLLPCLSLEYKLISGEQPCPPCPGCIRSHSGRIWHTYCRQGSRPGKAHTTYSDARRCCAAYRHLKTVYQNSILCRYRQHEDEDAYCLQQHKGDHLYRSAIFGWGNGKVGACPWSC